MTYFEPGVTRRESSCRVCAVGSDRFLWSLTVVGVAAAEDEEEGEEDNDVLVDDTA
jgi:hypothetical protein